MQFHRIVSFSLLALAISSSGCGIFLGNVKPVEEKSRDYGILDLSKDGQDWIKLPAEERSVDEESAPTEISDMVFQSKKTASIIALNSACRPLHSTQKEDLKNFTDRLILGISDLKFRNERELTLQGRPALETTIQGRLNQEPMMLRTVVLRRDSCVFDLMYISRPRFFKSQEKDFSAFVSSLKIQD